MRTGNRFDEANHCNDQTLKRVRHGIELVGPEQAFEVIARTATGVLLYGDLRDAWAAALVRIVELEAGNANLIRNAEGLAEEVVQAHIELRERQ